MELFVWTHSYKLNTFAEAQQQPSFKVQNMGEVVDQMILVIRMSKSQ